MPFETGSFTNKYWKRLYFISGTFISMALVIFMLIPSEEPLAHSAKNDLREIEILLKKANQNISISPDLAEQMAGSSASLSAALHNNHGLIRSWLVLGKINDLKGKNEQALNFYSQAERLGRQKNFPAEACEAIIETGEIFYKNGEYDRALGWFRKADSLAAKQNFEHLRAYALYYIGKYNQTRGNFIQAKHYYLSAVGIGRKKKDNKLLALILPSLGKNYISEGQLYLALTNYQEAFYISSQLNDPLFSADICNHLGSLYLQLNEYDKAMEYHRKALQYRLHMNYPDGLAKSYNNIGKVFLDRQEPDSAEYYFAQSLALCQRIHYKKGTIKALNNLGKVYKLRNQPGQAARYLSEAWQAAQAAGYTIGMAESALDLADLHKEAGRLDTAIRYYTFSLQTLLKTNYHETLIQVHKGLYECYQSLKDYKRALAHHVEILNVEKKMLDVENKRQLAILNITFDTERKEKDYQVLLKENELKKSLLKKNTIALWLVAAVLSFMVLLCLYIYNRFYSKKRANRLLEAMNYRVTNQNAEFERLNRELEQVSREKDKLFSIISHELRNPLYWLQNLAEVLSRRYQTMSPEKIKKSLQSLDESAKNVYHLMDNLLHWSRSKLNRVHPRKSGCNLLELVAETTQMYESFFRQKEIGFRMDLPVQVSIYADPDLFCCVIRNLVSNAIKYTPGGGEIVISCRIDNSEVVLVVSDSGKGISSNDLESIFAADPGQISMPGLMQEKGSGLGLRLCKDFVEMNNGRIWAQSQPDFGTQFFFTVPLHGELPSIHEVPEPELLLENVL